ncbi:hypothetical protein J6590_066258 [Homalodisca vitripennis]|nr:hypothetical protein J6590_066258 [Homalodisca vitripennis]
MAASLPIPHGRHCTALTARSRTPALSDTTRTLRWHEPMNGAPPWSGGSGVRVVTDTSRLETGRDAHARPTPRPLADIAAQNGRIDTPRRYTSRNPAQLRTPLRLDGYGNIPRSYGTANSVLTYRRLRRYSPVTEDESLFSTPSITDPAGQTSCPSCDWKGRTKGHPVLSQPTGERDNHPNYV